MKIWKLSVAIPLALMGSGALATPEKLELFLDHYHVKDTSALVDEGCKICHVSDEDRHFNPYGEDVKNAEGQTGGKLTWQTLALLESKDSNGDGKTNLQNIVANSPPGAVVAPKAGAAPAPVAAKKKSLIPRHAFHPAIVHFPIALIMVAFLLDFLALVMKKPILHKMAQYNLILGTVSGLFAIGSGLGVMAFKQLPYSGILLTHIEVALASIVCAAISIVARRMPGKTWQGVAFVAVLLAAVLIANAGHFGGTFVYGE